MVAPASRGWICRPGGPEAERAAACQAAAAVAGRDALGDGTGIVVADAAGRHRSVIPDTRLCSGGRERYRGLDLPRPDWPATTLTSGEAVTLRYRTVETGPGTLQLFLTRQDYLPNQPLSWSDLDAQPFASFTNPVRRGDGYQLRVRLPARPGRHVLYAIWQRSDNPQASYSCSDLVLTAPTGSAAGRPGTTPGAGPASPSPAAPSGSGTAGPPRAEWWQANTEYQVGDLVSYDGNTYRCRQKHRSLAGWEPSAVPMFWEKID